MRMGNGKWEISNPRIRIPHSAFRNSPGFTYIALLAAIVIIGITLGVTGKYWSNVMLREKEEELLFRGDEYWRAIRKYSTAVPGRTEYPPSIEELLKDSRSATGKRHLRRQYKDPMTGEDFVLIRQKGTRRIVGVRSASDKEPLRQGNFPVGDNIELNTLHKKFEGKKKYEEWRFIYVLPNQPEPQTEDEIVQAKPKSN